LIAKFKAVVGKYLTTLAVFPLQNALIPSSLETLLKQSKTLVYGLSLRAGFVWAVYINNLTLSIGAQAVLAMAPDVPPTKKSTKKFELDFF
jgi:hypothetical protein